MSSETDKGGRAVSNVSALLETLGSRYTERGQAVTDSEFVNPPSKGQAAGFETKPIQSHTKDNEGTEGSVSSRDGLRAGEDTNTFSNYASIKNNAEDGDGSENEYGDESIISDKHSVSSSESRSLQNSNVRSLSPNSEGSRRRMLACKRCHSLKVKCVPLDTSVEFSTCKRCFKRNISCEYNTLHKRKKPAPLTNSMKFKIKDDEIGKLREELKRKDRLIKLLRGFTDEEEEKMVSEISMHDRLKLYGKEINELEAMLPSSSSSSQFISNSERRVQLGESQMSSLDIIGNNILTFQQCEKLLHLFLNKVYSKFPFIDLPSTLTVEFLREHEPFMFIIMVYIGTIADTEPSDISVESQLQLECLISKTIAIHALVIGNKSINLLKSTMLYSLWYTAPELFHQRRYHLFSSFCASMAHDLGVSGRPFFFYNKDDGLVKKTSVLGDLHTIKLKALILVVYISYMSTSLFLKRVIFFQWTEYLDNSCVLLEGSGLRSYRMIALYARMNHLMETIYCEVHKQSEQITVLELSSTRNKLQLVEYLNQLNGLKQKISDNFRQNSPDYSSLMAYMYSVQAYLYEPALQTLINSKEYVTPEYKNVFFSTLSQICESCLLSLKHFNQLSIEDMTSNPLFHVSRILYTSGMLLRIRYLSLTIPKSGKASLFTEECISTIRTLTAKVEKTCKMFPKNHALKKVANVLGLFVHTCLSQWYISYKSLSKEIKKHTPLFVDPLFDSDANPQGKRRATNAIDKSGSAASGDVSHNPAMSPDNSVINGTKHSAAFKPLISSLLQPQTDETTGPIASYKYGLNSQQHRGSAVYSVAPSPPTPVLHIASNSTGIPDGSRPDNSIMKFQSTPAYNNMNFNSSMNVGNLGSMPMEQQPTGLDQLAGIAVGDLGNGAATNLPGRVGSIEGIENNWEFQYMAFNDEFWSDLFFGNGESFTGPVGSNNGIVGMDPTPLNLQTNN